MAIEFAFEMGAPATVDQVDQAMTRSATTHHMAGTGRQRFDHEGTFLASGMYVSNYAPSPLPFPDPVQVAFGFNPVVNVLFRQYKDGEFRPQDWEVVRLVADTLTEVAGDALLTFAGEIAMLVRLDGRLAVDVSKDFWTSDTIALLPPHDSAAISNL